MVLHFIRAVQFVFAWHTITKNGKDHRLPLSPQIVEILKNEKRQSQSSNVFSFGGDRFIASRTINNWCSELSHKVGIKFTSHDLRKLTADSLQDRGVNSEVIEMILNHSQGDLDKVYKQRYSQTQMRLAIEEWAKVVLGRCKLEGIV